MTDSLSRTWIVQTEPEDHPDIMNETFSVKSIVYESYQDTLIVTRHSGRVDIINNIDEWTRS